MLTPSFTSRSVSSSRIQDEADHVFPRYELRCLRKASCGSPETQASIFADLDPGEPETPLVTLETIVRSDADGLERMLPDVSGARGRDRAWH